MHRVTRLDTAPALAMPGVARVLTGADVPGVNDAGVKHDEPLFPDEVMFVGHAVCWVLGETLEAARLGAAAVEVDYEPLPSIVALTEAIAAASFQGGQPVVGRGDVEDGLAGAARVFSGVTEMAGQEHFYLETHASLALVDEDGQIFVQSSTQHPTETQEIVAHVLGLHNHHVTVQCLRMGGGFGGKEMQPHGFAAIAALGATLTGRPVRLRLDPHPRHDDDRQAARLPRPVAGRLRRRGSAPGARGHADLRRRLEPRPQRARAGAGAVPRRQRLLDPPRPPARPGRPHPQDLADRLPWLRRPAGDARHRGHPRPVRTAARDRADRPAPTQLLRRGPGHAVRAAGAPSRADRHRLGPGAERRAGARSGWPRSTRSTPRTSTPSAAWR